MTNKQTKKTTRKTPPAEGGSVETYRAPAPPSKGRIIGLDCHPDTFTAAVFIGQTPHDARKIGSRENLSLEALLKWAAGELTGQDIILMEAGSNSFELSRRLGDLGLRTCVLESAHVGKHAKTYADNDKMAAARIVRVYLAGMAPAVWVPDTQTGQLRELLHAYQKSVRDETAAINSLKGYLNQFTVRLGKRSTKSAATRQWILRQRAWSPLQQELLADSFAQLDAHHGRRRHFLRLISAEVCRQPLMLRLMKVLGISTINAFALVATIGDVRRFATAAKLVAYAGLNPGQRQSGHGKNIKLGMGRRGRGDLRSLLIQGAHAVLRSGKKNALGQWGWKLFARKGHRNIAVAAIARKMIVQVWHLLCGHTPIALEVGKSLAIKLQKLLVTLGKEARHKLGLNGTLSQAVAQLQQTMLAPPPQPD
jgi:transposase